MMTTLDVESTRTWHSWLFLCLSIYLSKRVLWELVVKHAVYSLSIGFFHLEFVSLVAFGCLNLSLFIKIFYQEWNHRLDSKYAMVMIGQLFMFLILGVIQLAFNMSVWDHKQYLNEFWPIESGRFCIDILMLFVCILVKQSPHFKCRHYVL